MRLWILLIVVVAVAGVRGEESASESPASSSPPAAAPVSAASRDGEFAKLAMGCIRLLGLGRQALATSGERASPSPKPSEGEDDKKPEEATNWHLADMTNPGRVLEAARVTSLETADRCVQVVEAIGRWIQNRPEKKPTSPPPIPQSPPASA